VCNLDCGDCHLATGIHGSGIHSEVDQRYWSPSGHSRAHLISLFGSRVSALTCSRSLTKGGTRTCVCVRYTQWLPFRSPELRKKPFVCLFLQSEKCCYAASCFVCESEAVNIMSAEHMMCNAKMPWDPYGKLPFYKWLSPFRVEEDESRLHCLGNIVIPRCAALAMHQLEHEARSSLAFTE